MRFTEELLANKLYNFGAIFISALCAVSIFIVPGLLYSAGVPGIWTILFVITMILVGGHVLNSALKTAKLIEAAESKHSEKFEIKIKWFNFDSKNSSFTLKKKLYTQKQKDDAEKIIERINKIVQKNRFQILPPALEVIKDDDEDDIEISWFNRDIGRTITFYIENDKIVLLYVDNDEWDEIIQPDDECIFKYLKWIKGI